MKTNYYLLGLFILVLILSSCEKSNDDQTYNGKLLKKISFDFENRSILFIYNSDGTMKQIRFNENNYYAIGIITYNEKKIENIELTYYQNNGTLDEVINYQYSYSGQTTTITEIWDDANQNTNKFYMNSNNKLAKWENSELEEVFTWTENNVTELIMSTPNYPYPDVTDTYQYDSHKNPYSLIQLDVLEWLYITDFQAEYYLVEDLFSANNMIKKWQDGTPWLNVNNRSLNYNSDDYLSLVTIPSSDYYPEIQVSFEYN